ncbi:MAG: site-specific DNA-methyltransferase, partial [bacterium]
MLLEQVFPDARIQMATIVITPSGIEQDRLSRVEEYAYFCFFGSAPKPLSLGDDLLQPEAKIRTIDSSVAWESLLRRGTGSARSARPSMFYPVFIDADAKKIVGVGEPMLDGDPDPAAKINGHAVAWPIRTSGDWGRWRLGAATLNSLIVDGYVRLGGYDSKRGTWTLSYLGDKTRKQIKAKTLVVASRDANGVAVVSRDVIPRVSVKTVWNRSRHNAGVHGSTLLSTFLGRSGVFAFPKSLYAVRDTLDIVTHDKPEALILDFFAGSGTTLHATMILNGQDRGRRRCLLVTNNEVSYETAASLNKRGHFRGDPEFEAAGVFQAACRPRVTAAVTGRRPDGEPIPGSYLDGSDYAEGFAENVEFFRLDYQDPAAVELGLRFDELHPLLWLIAGAVGEREQIDSDARFALQAGSPYAVLFDPSGVADLIAGLVGRPDVH